MEIELLERNKNILFKTEDDEPDKCDNYDNLKTKIYDLQKTLVKFTKGRDNLNVLLGNQIVSYNNAGLGYEPKKNSRNLENICKVKTISHCKTLKCNYYNK